MKIIITLLLLTLSQFSLAKITVNVDRDPVVADESFQLVFESDQKVDAEPDFSPLDRSFTILNSRRRSNTQIINGKVNHSQMWILTLLSNKSGIIGIPSIRFGKELTQPRTIKVVPSAPVTKGKSSDDIFIDVEVNTKTPYVQAQVVYTVKLYRSVATNNASLSEPVLSGGQAVINKFGEDSSFEAQLNGKRYVVIQRQYVIFPQSSGALKIEPLMFQGQTGKGGFFNYDPFGPQAQSIVKRSAEINLEVKPIPDSFSGDTWLPASQLTIQEQWSVDPGKLQQGEATTRTLTLAGNGLAASHLPAIKSNLPVTLKQYPDQPEFEETNDANGFIGIRRDKMAIIPTEGGDYMLPAIKVPWWNTDTDKMEIAELPERSIHVDGNVTAPVDSAIKEQLVTNEMTPSELEDSNETIIKSLDTVDRDSQWKWVSLVLLVLWSITLIIFWKSKRNISTTKSSTDTTSSNRHYLKQIKQACKKNDPIMAKQSLLDWARNLWPEKNIGSIDSIKELCAEDFQLELDKLNNCLYGKAPNSWNGAEFLKCFESQSFEKKQSVETSGKLEPLYKT
jgi:BatD DUF11 like domain